MHRTLRILSTALITAGLVVLADVGATLAWEEPVSSVYGAIQQQRAEGELEDLEEEFAERTLPNLGELGDPRTARRLANAFERQLEVGKAMGRIEIPAIDVDVVTVQGTGEGTLQKGPGHYSRTGLPGQGTTVGIAGHRTTYLAPFRDINELTPGDEILVEVPYGVFTYELERSRVVDPADVGVVRDLGRERIVLTACHPLYSAAERYVVFGRPVEFDLTPP